MRKSFSDSIAIIGMACRFPGANDYPTFFSNLVAGKESIQEIPDSFWRGAQTGDQRYRWAGLLNDVATFDARFFGITPREAQFLDPQQRLLLEETWHCIEDAGISPSELVTHPTSVYVGATTSDYQHLHIENRIDDRTACTGTFHCLLANRISYFLNLSGESIALDTACSSSLTAVHHAVLALRSQRCDYALVGAVNLIRHPWKQRVIGGAHMLAKDGRCKTFDHLADGYVPGEGIGVVLLCRSDFALENKLRVHAEILGTAVNHGGRTQSLTAPRIDSQAAVIRAAYRDASCSPAKTSYVEAHGTGTSLGDPIEVAALSRVFGKPELGGCAIGSVKSNIGHLEPASGMAGLIKVACMMKGRVVPPTLNLKRTNPLIDFEDSFFRPVTTVEKLNGHTAAQASVSSFGFGGANAHVVLGEAKSQEASTVPVGNSICVRTVDAQDKSYGVVLSARSRRSLCDLVKRYIEFSRTQAFRETSLASLSRTLVHGRKHLPLRISNLVRTKEELVIWLEKMAERLLNKDEKFKNIHREPKVMVVVGSEFGQEVDFHQKFTRALDTLRRSGLKVNYFVGVGEGGVAMAPMLKGRELFGGVEKELVPVALEQYGNWSWPAEIDVKKLQSQIAETKMGSESRQIFGVAADLLDSQQTFIKLLAGWGPGLCKYGIDCEGLIQLASGDAQLGSKVISEEHVKLLVCMFLSSWQSLRKKWGLTSAFPVKQVPEVLWQLATYVSEGVLSREGVLELLLSTGVEKKLLWADCERSKWRSKPIAKGINQNVHFSGEVEPHLRREKSSFFQKLESPPEVSFTIRIALSQDETEEFDSWLVGKCLDLRLAQFDQQPAGFLLRLWELGTANLESKVFALDEAEIARLPTYPFEKREYWIEEH